MKVENSNRVVIANNIIDSAMQSDNYNSHAIYVVDSGSYTEEIIVSDNVIKNIGDGMFLQIVGTNNVYCLNAIIQGNIFSVQNGTTPAEDGILVDNLSHVSFVGNVIHSVKSDRSVRFNDCNDLLVAQNHIVNHGATLCPEESIYLEHCSRSRIEGNLIYSTNDTKETPEITVDLACGNVSIQGNTIYTYSIIEAVYANVDDVSHNTVINNSDDGVGLLLVGLQGAVVGNYIRVGENGICIDMAGSAKKQITGNYFVGGSAAKGIKETLGNYRTIVAENIFYDMNIGISFEGEPQHWNISENVFFANSNMSVAISNYSTSTGAMLDIIIQGNSFYGCSSYSLYFKGDGEETQLQISNNQFFCDSLGDVLISPDNLDGFNFIGNMIYKPKSQPIVVHNIAYANISENRCYADFVGTLNDAWFLMVTNGGLGVNISGNVIQNSGANAGYAVILFGVVKSGFIGNTIMGGKCGIWLQTSPFCSHVRINNNGFHNLDSVNVNGVAIFLDGSVVFCTILGNIISGVYNGIAIDGEKNSVVGNVISGATNSIDLTLPSVSNNLIGNTMEGGITDSGTNNEKDHNIVGL
jgi:hypothetical protein